MIKLQLANSSDALYVAPEQIVLVSEGPFGDTISTYIELFPETSRSIIYVKESAKEVVRLITEYKQRQMRLQAAYDGWFSRHSLRDELADDIGLLESEDRP